MGNVHVNITENLRDIYGSSTSACGGTLHAYSNVVERVGADPTTVEGSFSCTYREPAITPSLATLEKAVSTRIYFENLYFPLLRQRPSREQRRAAMEKNLVRKKQNCCARNGTKMKPTIFANVGGKLMLRLLSSLTLSVMVFTF